MNSIVADPAPAGTMTEEAVALIVARNGNAMLCVARRFSACPADAEDAYQNALEKLITKAPEVKGDELAAWLNVVVRNEALMIGRRHKHVDRSSFEDVAGEWVDDTPSLDERLLDDESFGRRREAFRRLKPDQMRCLLLKADGMDYGQISSSTGISYASVNRYLTDGRRAIRQLLGRIESGEECRRIEPLLSMLADGEAGERELRDAKLHLEHCAACRAALIDFRRAPECIAAMFPVALISTASGGILRQVADGAQSVFAHMQDRLAGYVTSVHPGADLAFAKKATAVTAIATALAAGGAGIEQVASDDTRPAATQEFVADPMLQPSAVAGPTPAGGTDARAPVPSESKPVTPSAEEVIVAGDRDRLTNSPSSSDAAPGDDQFSAEPQFDTPPETFDDPSPDGDDSYDGFAP